MKILLTILPLFLLGANSNCTKCELNRLQMKCEYYVAKKGDLSQKESCRVYAKYLLDTEVFAKASWYYLLAKEPDMTVKSAKKALSLNQDYAKRYLAIAYLLKGDKSSAKKALEGIKRTPLLEKELEIIKKVYPDFNEKEVLEYIK